MRYNNPAILRNRATNRIAGLHDPFNDAGFEQINFGQSAITTEDEGITAIARIDGRSVREITQTINARIGLLRTGVDQGNPTGRPFNNQAQITCTSQLRPGTGIQQNSQ